MPLILSLCLMVLLCAVPVHGQLQRFDLQIPVPTDTWLAGDLYAADSTSARPVILIQTPYNKEHYQDEGVPLDIGDNYALVILDWRGFYASDHAAQDGAPGYGEDGATAIAWLADQNWCNGRVGTWGGSALGDVQFKTAREQPPALVCAAPWIHPMAMHYEQYYHGGVLRTEYLLYFGLIWPDVAAFVLEHPTEDVAWDLAFQLTDSFEDITVPMHITTGWWDLAPDLVIDTFHELQQRSAMDVRDQHRLLIGPWEHSNVDSTTTGDGHFPNAERAAHDDVMAYFDHHLRELDNGWEDQAAVRVYDLGPDMFVDHGAWPPSQATELTLFLGEGTLTESAPALPDLDDEFVYDPRDPVPTLGGRTFLPLVPVGPASLSELTGRPDILIYDTPVLSDPLRLTGPVSMTLYATSDKADTDVAVLLADVHPDGTPWLLTDGIRRFRFAHGFDEEELVPSGDPVALDIRMQSLSATIRPGHRLRLYVTGSNFSRFDRNLNNGGPMYTEGDTLLSTTRVLRGSDRPSALHLTTTSLADATHRPAPIRPSAPIHVTASPNPFNATTRVLFTLDHAGMVSIRLVNVLGREVARWPARSYAAGRHQVHIDGSSFASGVYLVQVLAEAHPPATRKLLLLR